jgi:hypothetical protein
MSRYAYIGRRIQNGKLQHCFKEKGDDARIVWWPKAKVARFRGALIGFIYEIGESLPDRWADAEVGTVAEGRRLRWQTEDMAANMHAKEIKRSVTPDLDRYVDALRDARKMVPRSQQAAFDAWLLNKIR